MSKHRDVMGDPFAGGDDDVAEAVDPLSGLTNLADCMLVLACGLMVALVVHWNLDVSPHYEGLQETGNLVDVEEDPEAAILGNSESDEEGEEIYENMGTLYRDTTTGKFYYIREGEQGGSE